MTPQDPAARADTNAFSALSGLDVEDVIGVRRLGDITFEQPVHLGDKVALEVSVDQRHDLTADDVVIETSWRIVDELGQTLVEFRADMVCRRCRKDVSEAGDADLE